MVWPGFTGVLHRKFGFDVRKAESTIAWSWVPKSKSVTELCMPSGRWGGQSGGVRALVVLMVGPLPVLCGRGLGGAQPYPGHRGPHAENTGLLGLC